MWSINNIYIYVTESEFSILFIYLFIYLFISFKVGFMCCYWFLNGFGLLFYLMLSGMH
ncbi:MAG: hypothetical protein N7Q72_03620 [Spiroplasma sp. Tabriz.8]|nr:hypothetical protein [Spiroplasma sp. Tabriz.8]